MNIEKLAKGTLAAGTLFCLSMAAQAASVTYSAISSTDGDDLSGFSVAGTTASGDTLNIDVSPFVTNAGAMTDTITFTVTADPGHYITGLSYAEEGVYMAAAGAAGAVVQLLANNSGPMAGTATYAFGDGNWTLSQMVDLTGQNLTSVSVSVLNVLWAAGAAIDKQSASLTATVAPIPLPAAVWMLGTSLASLLVVTGRNRRA
jgi:hypothetical protein